MNLWVRLSLKIFLTALIVQSNLILLKKSNTGTLIDRPTDYFQTSIKMGGKIDICKVYGSYLSFIEFNNVRYWDIRENTPIKLIDIPTILQSSSQFRLDRINLEQGK